MSNNKSELPGTFGYAESRLNPIHNLFVSSVFVGGDFGEFDVGVKVGVSETS